MVDQFYNTMALLDVEIIRYVQTIGSSWYHVAWLLSSIIGSLRFLAPAVILSLFFIGKKRIAAEVLIISFISFVSVFFLKMFLEIPRPSLIDDGLSFQYLLESDFGMPSGHAFFSVIIFGWLFLRHPKSFWLSSGSVVLILLIGLSRIYLGVHYPSQVLAGWLLGILFLFVFKAIDRRLWTPFQKRFR